MGISGNDEWKSNGIKIYLDGSTEEECTLDGNQWLDGGRPEDIAPARKTLNCQTGLCKQFKNVLEI